MARSVPVRGTDLDSDSVPQHGTGYASARGSPLSPTARNGASVNRSSVRRRTVLGEAGLIAPEIDTGLDGVLVDRGNLLRREVQPLHGG